MFLSLARLLFTGLALPLLVLLLTASISMAANLRVPDEYATIQAAINAASDGDVVLVGPGHYRENPRITYKDVSLVSSAGPEATIIDGGSAGATVSFYNCNGSPRLEGFTVTNGSNSGLSIIKANPEIANCIISGNSNWTGGGVYAHSGSCPVRISNSVITDNHSASYGGGIASNQACVEVFASEISGNSSERFGGGLASIGFCSGIRVEHSQISDNESTFFGGGLYTSGSDRCPPGIWSKNNLVINNSAYHGGGYYQGRSGRSELRNDTVSQNVAQTGGGFIALSSSTYYKIFNSIIYHNSSLPWLPPQTVMANENIIAGSNIEGCAPQTVAGAESDICADPLFVDPSNSDFKLESGSPCIDRGIVSYRRPERAEQIEMPDFDFAGKLRLQGAGIDMGAYEMGLTPVVAEVKITPQTINLNSAGRWITAHITLPDEYDPSGVAIDSITLNGAIPIEHGQVDAGKIMVKFDRELLIDYLESFEDDTEFFLRGEVPGQVVFQGSDWIRVIARQGKTARKKL
jgi:hypothetical protein